MRKLKPTLWAAVVGVAGVVVLLVWLNGSGEGGSTEAQVPDAALSTHKNEETVEDRTDRRNTKQEIGTDGCALAPPAPPHPHRALELDLHAVGAASAAAGGRQLGSIAIMGIAHNIGREKIEQARRAIDDLGHGIFQGNFHTFIYENDSTDCTASVLTEWMRDDRSHVHVLTDRLGAVAPRGVHNKRIYMIAQFRNRVIRMMKEFQGKKFDYVWVIDWDMLPWKAETVASAFLQKQPWDMVCANGVMSKYDMRYYDAFAYRSEEFPGGPAQHPGAYFGAAGYVSNVMVGAARGVDSPMVPVDSCFGGMALYKANLFDGCTYSSDDGDCEHVHLHRCMKAVNPGARFFMLPSMRIVYDLDQGEIAGYNVKIKRR